jgi:sarcosine oxidase subunit beta
MIEKIVKREIVIVGGGSTGSSILYHLAKRGMKDALLLERAGQIASGQTSKSTALVRTHYSNPTVTRMALNSLNFFKRFEQEMNGCSAGFKQTGLIIGGDKGTEDGIRNNLVMHQKLGIESRVIDSREAKRIEPEIDPSSFETIVYEPNSGYADPSLTASAFSAAAQELGASVITESRVTDIKKMGNGSTSYHLETTRGEIETSKVVLATGVWSKELLEKLKLDFIPIKPVRHPVVIYRRPEIYQGTRPLIFDFPRRMYYKPEGNSLFYAGSIELELDTSQGEVDPDNYVNDVSFSEIEQFSKSVAECVPIMGQRGVYVSGYTGVYDVTPDQEPIIDNFATEGKEGLYCLIGLSGHGFKLCPEFGRIMAALVLDQGFRDYDVSIFQSNRFEKGALIKSRYALGTVA